MPRKKKETGPSFVRTTYATLVRADRNDDGVNVVIAFDGKLLEVHGLPGKAFKPADIVKLDLETKRILA